ncbi:MAG: SDR family oxidoreductase [Alphaproteobacteria bacterium]|jgi:NAD(P)-dependent dehydrogenase (short-subunit alcohol dehydrogenase family)|nr:SDR family oxidoreductase [Alphaproteobacteria bacterium]MDP6564368.1 SDR family oxidoreductase [Alphaproteobacteria bacterium]MDP6812538.1 SDR family oxidoreductase [Alphaproteobacteria bacterium]
METILITGASRGVGLELTRQYAAGGWRVFACCRDPDTAEALHDLARQSNGAVSLHALDVDQAASVAALKVELGAQPLDVLINNAGIMGQRNARRGNVDYDAWQACLDTNVLGPTRVVEAFADNVAAGAQKKLITISSRMGSIGQTLAGDSIVYRSSKAAVNMVMKIIANDLADQGVIVVVFHPGWVRTDMGGPGADISVEESAGGIRQVIAGLSTADNGGFRNYDGGIIEW